MGDAKYLKAFEQETISGAADTFPLAYLKSIHHWGKQINEMRNEAHWFAITYNGKKFSTTSGGSERNNNDTHRLLRQQQSISTLLNIGSTLLRVAGDRWLVASGRWQVGGGSWKKFDNLIKLLFATWYFSFPETFRKLPNISVGTWNVPMKRIFNWSPVPKIQF